VVLLELVVRARASVKRGHHWGLTPVVLFYEAKATRMDLGHRGLTL